MLKIEVDGEKIQFKSLNNGNNKILFSKEVFNLIYSAIEILSHQLGVESEEKIEFEECFLNEIFKALKGDGYDATIIDCSELRKYRKDK